MTERGGPTSIHELASSSSEREMPASEARTLILGRSELAMGGFRYAMDRIPLEDVMEGAKELRSLKGMRYGLMGIHYIFRVAASRLKDKGIECNVTYWEKLDQVEASISGKGCVEVMLMSVGPPNRRFTFTTVEVEDRHYIFIDGTDSKVAYTSRNYKLYQRLQDVPEAILKAARMKPPFAAVEWNSGPGWLISILRPKGELGQEAVLLLSVFARLIDTTLIVDI